MYYVQFVNGFSIHTKNQEVFLKKKKKDTMKTVFVDSFKCPKKKNPNPTKTNQNKNK